MIINYDCKRWKVRDIRRNNEDERVFVISRDAVPVRKRRGYHSDILSVRIVYTRSRERASVNYVGWKSLSTFAPYDYLVGSIEVDGDVLHCMAADRRVGPEITHEFTIPNDGRVFSWRTWRRELRAAGLPLSLREIEQRAAAKAAEKAATEERANRFHDAMMRRAKRIAAELHCTCRVQIYNYHPDKFSFSVYLEEQEEKMDGSGHHVDVEGVPTKWDTEKLGEAWQRANASPVTVCACWGKSQRAQY